METVSPVPKKMGVVHANLLDHINRRRPLLKLVRMLHWEHFEAEFAARARCGRSSLPDLFNTVCRRMGNSCLPLVANVSVGATPGCDNSRLYLSV